MARRRAVVVGEVSRKLLARGGAECTAPSQPLYPSCLHLQSPLTAWGPGCAAGLVAEEAWWSREPLQCHAHSHTHTHTHAHTHTGQWGKDEERSFCPLTPALQPGRGSGPQVFPLDESTQALPP